MRAALGLVIALAACGGSRDVQSTGSATTTTPAPPPTPAPAPTPTPAPEPEPPKPAPPPAPVGQDFIDDAKALYRIVGCEGGALPAAYSDPKFQTVVDKHCKAIHKDVEKYRTEYFGKARQWFADKVPADATQLVYLFSGADLLSALVAFPNATEITTMSLELAGDPRPYAKLTPAELERDLAAYRVEQGLLIQVGSNSSKNLSKQQRRYLPGQVSSFLLAMAIGGYEPVAMRFFKIQPDGTLHYFTREEIDADVTPTSQLRATWNKPTFTESFRHSEIQYRKIGDTTVRTHRHIAWNVEDKYLAEHGDVLKHLTAKGKVFMMVKGGSYLLWLSNFKTIRGYILGNLKWMLSDSTGPAPTHAKPAGMIQEGYGKYTGPVDEIKVVEGTREDLDMKALFARPAGPMPFRFGYLDKNNNKHVLITRPK